MTDLIFVCGLTLISMQSRVADFNLHHFKLCHCNTGYLNRIISMGPSVEYIVGTVSNYNEKNQKNKEMRQIFMFTNTFFDW